ncbi:hypothetical protein TPAR_00395 [Tolypocladium paradoxum]|uniref:Uncharacterized protein n=1 Tax=Tolypocladium paradoxum TaxID=94208 RepID=A0A2S4LAD7_9HYPO|nr:hypothetical protein TPAR_00395 [Tolypocladium paradoxum]
MSPQTPPQEGPYRCRPTGSSRGIPAAVFGRILRRDDVNAPATWNLRTSFYPARAAARNSFSRFTARDC